MEKLVKLKKADLEVTVKRKKIDAYQLSNLDHMMRLHNVRLVYYYKKANSDLIGRLKDSLKTVLLNCPQVGGRLHKGDKGKREIKYNNDNNKAKVKVVDATVDSTFENWLKEADRSAELKLCTWEDLASDPLDNFPLVYVQFNAFKGDGLAIGICCGHMLADPSCLTLIMEIWGETHRKLRKLSEPLCFKRPGVLEPSGNNDVMTATGYYKTFQTRDEMVKKGSSIKFKTVTYKFKDDMVDKCMSRFKSDEYKGENLTPFAALSALFWAACIRDPVNKQQDARLSICTEFRRIIFPDVPNGQFGNALHFSEVRMSEADLTNLSADPTNLSKLWRPANAIGDKLKPKTEELTSVIDWLENQKNKKVRRHLYGRPLTAINGENFHTYKSVFEKDEKPFHVSYYVEPMLGDGLIFVLPSDEGILSRTVMLTLPEQHATSACQYLKTFKFVPKPGRMI